MVGTAMIGRTLHSHGISFDGAGLSLRARTVVWVSCYHNSFRLEPLLNPLHQIRFLACDWESLGCAELLQMSHCQRVQLLLLEKISHLSLVESLARVSLDFLSFANTTAPILTRHSPLAACCNSIRVVRGELIVLGLQCSAPGYCFIADALIDLLVFWKGLVFGLGGDVFVQC
jgi:hypothetical protein